MVDSASEIVCTLSGDVQQRRHVCWINDRPLLLPSGLFEAFCLLAHRRLTTQTGYAYDAAVLSALQVFRLRRAIGSLMGYDPAYQLIQTGLRATYRLDARVVVAPDFAELPRGVLDDRLREDLIRLAESVVRPIEPAGANTHA